MKLGPFWRKRNTELHELVRRISVYIDYFLWLLLDPAKFKIVKTQEINSILGVLINPEKGNVGGDFCFLGVLEYFKKKNPGIRVAILGDFKSLERFGKVPGIDMIVYKNRKDLEKLRNKGFKAALFVNLGPLKPRDFLFVPYRVLTFYPSIRALFIYKNRLRITRKPFAPWGTHMVEFGFKMLEVLGFKFDKKDVLFYYSEEEKKVKTFLKKNKVEKFIIVHPGGKFVVETLQRKKWPPHLWPLNRYSKVAEHFSKIGYKILVTGTKDESLLFGEIKKGCNRNTDIIDCCGKFTIRELGALLDKTKLLIATDTAIVHIAYQIKTKIVELIGPSVPEAVGAWPLDSKRHRILIDNGSCSRSMRKIECPEDIVCLGNIKVQDVIKAGEELLKQKS